VIATALLLDLVAPVRRRPIRYLSLCSGIEAATSAWHRLGWQPVAFCEIEKFPSAVLKHHYPKVPNLGDMTRWREWPEDLLALVDVLVGGTPCQAFSVAGLRNSLNDDRGNLTLVYAHIVARIDEIRAARGLPPVILVWENVPGVLSTKDNAFGCFLGALAGEDEALVPAGKKWSNAGFVSGPERSIAWRVLDAQYFGVAQRRRRVFLVGSARTGFRPEQVLFEFDGLRRDSAPSRETREVAPTIPARSTAGGGLGTDFDCDGGVIEMATWWDGGQVSQTLDAVLAKGQTMPEKNRFPAVLVPNNWPADITPTLNAHFGEKQGLEDQHINGGGLFVPATAHTLRGEGFDASEDGTGRGTPLVPVDLANVSPTLKRDYGKGYGDGEMDGGGLIVHGTQDPCVDKHIAFAQGRNNGGENVIAFSCKDYGGDAGDVSPTLRSMNHSGSHPNAGGQVAVCFDTTQITSRENRCNPQPGDPCHPLAAGAHPPAIAIQDGALRENPSSGPQGKGYQEELAYTLEAREALSKQQCVATTAVRRLTVTECHRLQGFSDDHCRIPWRGKPAEECPDGPQYKALGNSMAVPCMAWIGQRIAKVIDRVPDARRLEGGEG
jgi:DNA (cytosine-5)-methyltransferase 1